VLRPAAYNLGLVSSKLDGEGTNLNPKASVFEKIRVSCELSAPGDGGRCPVVGPLPARGVLGGEYVSSSEQPDCFPCTISALGCVSHGKEQRGDGNLPFVMCQKRQTARMVRVDEENEQQEGLAVLEKMNCKKNEEICSVYKMQPVCCEQRRTMHRTAW
jgi:hypothetical protein